MVRWSSNSTSLYSRRRYSKRSRSLSNKLNWGSAERFVYDLSLVASVGGPQARLYIIEERWLRATANETRLAADATCISMSMWVLVRR
jgi:hypothetical protein